MRLKDPSDGRRYVVTHSELFEATYYRVLATYPALDDVFDEVEWSMARTPLSDTEPCEVLNGVNLRLLVTPSTLRVPAIRFLIEVGEGRVHLWHLSVRSSN